MVTFVSQCEKRAIKRTQRVLDAFADRIGDRTWQTVMTEEGLLAVRKLLRKTATKNTAVSCHWLRSRSRSDLVWIVGNRQQFDASGLVPVNFTLKEVFMDEVSVHMIHKNEALANIHKQPLLEHLFAVGYVAKLIFEESIGKDDELKNLSQVVFLTGIMHDLGKLDANFQDWVKKGKQKADAEDGQHIETSKFSFEKYPRHNEVSLWLWFLLESKFGFINKYSKTLITHGIYWHHAKPYRKKDDFSGVFKVGEYISQYFNQEQISGLIQSTIDLLKLIQVVAMEYQCNEHAINKLSLDNLDVGKLLEEFEDRYEREPFPDFKTYSITDNFEKLQEKVRLNAQSNIVRACVVSADRVVSALSRNDLLEYVQEKRLHELVENLYQYDDALKNHLQASINTFVDTERTQKQHAVASSLAKNTDIAVLAGAAGSGKTKIALEWAMLQDAQQIIWICPRVQICQGIFDELTKQYLPDAKVEIFTGEFKYTNDWQHPTAESDYFSGHVVVTTIDQILGAITTHTKVNSLIPFLNAHIVFDEFHEYVPMEIFNLLFAELVAAKSLKSLDQKKILLVSATPNYAYLKYVLNIEVKDVIEMPSFNTSHYQIQFENYIEESREADNPLYQSHQQSTFVISNTAQTAQLSFMLNQLKENSILLHSKYKRSDKQYWFEQVYESFKKEGTNRYDVLRSGPIVQASLNISCNYMITEMTTPENLLQRLGRLDRYGENQGTNILKVVISEGIKVGKSIGASARFLNSLHGLQTSKVWYDFLQDTLVNKTFQLTELYQVYKQFYLNKSLNLSNLVDSKINQDLQAAIKASIAILTQKVSEPIKVVQVKSESKRSRISKYSLRGDNRFVQLALLDVNNPKSPQFINAYAYSEPISDQQSYDNLTESLSTIDRLGLLMYAAQKQGNIVAGHPVSGIPDKQFTQRCRVIEAYARDAEFPIYLSLSQDDLDKVGGSSQRHTEAIYYAICDKQPIGAISLQAVQNHTIENLGE